jgi:oligoendopeptidase F
MTDIKTLPVRSEAPVEQTWDLESVYPTPEAWEAAYRDVEGRLPALNAYRGRLGEGPHALAEFLELYQSAGVEMGKIALYARNASSVDSTDQAALGRLGQANSLWSRFLAASSFLDPELMAIGLDRVEEWLKTTPQLAFMAHYVDRLRRRAPHVRSDEVEEAAALLSDPFAAAFNTYSALTAVETGFRPAVASDGAELEVGQTSYGALITHPDRAVRRSAWESYADGYLALKNTHAGLLSAAVKQDVFNARLRRYGSALEASLGPNDIPVEVFHNLIATFRRNLPTWHRYWRLRKRALGVDEFEVYDIKAPLSAAKPVVPFAQAVEWITEGMAPMGDEYVEVLRRGCAEERWVDWALNRGKRDGAFSSGSVGTRPFIMMSYQDDLFSLSTLAHELGHSMHSYHSRGAQPYIYSRYSLFVAEVASNFNQAMVRDYLFRTQTDRNFQIALLEEAMSNYHRYFFIMPTLAQFELEVHNRAEQGRPLSAEILNGICADLFAEGYGDEVAREGRRERIGITWAQFLHMYMNFYVYQYATGISGAHALARGVMDGKPGAREAYIDFLKCGNSRYPLDALKLAGVDLLSPEPVDAAFAALAGYVDRLEELL